MNVAPGGFQAATNRCPMSSEEMIRQTLARLRARLNRMGLWQACALGLITLSFSSALTALVAVLAGPKQAYWAYMPLLVGVGITLFYLWKLWFAPKRELRSDAAVARWCEEHAGDGSAEFITAVQISLQSESSHSPLLVQEVMERSARHLSERDWEALDRRPRLPWLWGMGIGSVLFVVLLATLFPHVLSQAYTNLFNPPSLDSTGQKVVVIERTSVIEDIALEIQSPPYAGLSPRHSEGTRGRIQALAGSTVLVIGRTALPAKTALMLLESDPEGRWPVSLASNGVIKASMRVGAVDRYRFALVGQDGRVYLESRWRDVLADSDLAPTVKLLKPTTDVQVHPEDQIAISVDSSDDFGLETIELVVEPPRGKEVRRVLELGKGARELSTETVLRVDDLNLMPGDMATVVVEARDRNNVTGPGMGRSQSFRVFMANPEAEHEGFLGDLEKLLDGLIVLLADRLESPIDEGRKAGLSKVADWHEKIVESQTSILSLLEVIFASVGDHTRRKDEISKLLRTILTQLEAVLSSEKRQLVRIRERDISSPRPAVQLALLRSVNTDGIVQTEVTIFALKDWIDRSRQDNVMERGREMLSLQNELHDLLERLKESGDPKLAQDAQRHLDQLENHLRQMEEQMGKLAERVPYENQNAPTKPSDNAMDMQSMRDRIEKAKRLIKEGKVAEAMKLLEELNTDTQQMMARLSDEFKTGQPMTAKGQEGLSKVQSALRKLHGGQQELLDETGDSLQAQKEEIAKAFEKRLNDLQDQAEALKEKLKSVDGTTLHPSDGQNLNGLSEKAKRLAEDLKNAEIDAAKRGASEIGEGARSLRSEIGRSEERELELERQKSLRRAMKGLQEGHGQAKELEKQLSELKAELSKMRGAPGGRKDAQRFGKLGKKQGALGKKTSKLQKALRQLESEVPGLEQKLSPQLEEAKQSMERAMRQLKGQNPDAQGHQRDALERLGKALKGLEEQMKRDQKSEGTTGPNDPKEKVAIPDADAYQVPKEFREELLRAMKERAPKKFEKENRRFYEELVK